MHGMHDHHYHTHTHTQGSDDGLCFKTVAGGGLREYPASDVVVRRTTLASTLCNALQFGSATEVDMHDFVFEDLDITSGPKSGIGIVSMDSANISAVSFRNVSIHGANVATPVRLVAWRVLKSGARWGSSQGNPPHTRNRPLIYTRTVTNPPAH